MTMRRVFVNAILAAALTTGFAVAQDAPPPPDSQYPAAGASGQYNPPSAQDQDRMTQETTPQAQEPMANEPAADPLPAEQARGNQPTADQPEEGGYPQTAQQGPPPPDNQVGPDNQTSNDGTVIDDDSKDPSRRVARMQFTDGSVSIQPGGVNDWVAASLNRPMTTGDNVWTDKDSKAELNVGTGVFRMGAETSVTLANVGDNATQLQVHQGTLNLRVRHLYDGETYEIDTPNMAFTIQKPGDYRFDVDPNADTSYVTVWKGEGNATGEGPSVEVRQGEKGKFSNGTSMAYKIDRAPGMDQFDEWASARDQRDDNSVSAKYVSPDVIGSSDLDNYGTWQNNNDYGNVWVPNNQDDNWQPYSNGNWMYQQPYGWTWVGYEPWGFAPYHYGRWVYTGSSWGWAPGPYAYWGSPYYAPALVSWYGGGWGGGWGVNVGFGGGFGWCALGFGEPYYPWYRHGRSYFNNVNIRNTRITNITNITNNYYNNKGGGGGGYGYRGRTPANLRHGLVAANGRAVTNGLPIRNNRLNLNAQQRNALVQHPVNARNMGQQLRPTRQSFVGAAARGRTAVAPPSRVVSRPTYSKMTPPSPVQRGRGGDSIAARGAVNGRAAVNTPRPSAGLNNGRTAMNNNGRGNPMATRNVPRPPMDHNGAALNGGARSQTPMSRPQATFNRQQTPSNGGPRTTHELAPSANGRYVPRPPSAGVQSHGGATYARPGQSYSAPQTHNVPRPSGPVQQAPRSYSAPAARSYSNPSARSYGSSPSYGRGPSYSNPSPRSYNNPSARSYGSTNYGRGSSYSAPQHYSAPSAPRYSNPSYGRGPSYSAPQHYSAPSAPRYSAPSAPHYSAPSGGGGGHYSAPSHGGGGGYSGGGHASGGGGNHGNSGGHGRH